MKWTFLLLIFFTSSWAFSQAPVAETPKKFDVNRLLDADPDKQLAAALQFNAELRLAENKMREAQNELKRVKLAVASKLQAVRQERDKARETIGQADEKLQNAALPAAEKKAAEESRNKAVAIETVKNAELTQILGVAPLMPADAPASPYYVEKRHQSVPVAHPREQLPKDLVAQLDKDFAAKLTFDESFEMPLALGLAELQKKAGTKILIQTKLQSDQGDDALKIHFKIPKSEAPVSLGALFLLIEDQTEIEIYVRDYGLVIVPHDNNLPGTLLPLRDYLKKN
ncbi:hypothetical protein KIH39_19870 [Telmatocola sphagniphila]|jgi:hypothetical protein|uniref:Uncharacterized protein n=1 Tax=Telmatocola sphagniphila TaxID=1123043 RepID=A0A8E6B4R1_9BACT|nr:hypothetical protein [Telmatocola sphagniphila]QVL31086.1 hypothetical protein KIH39_19870 [Telmatocola sphagniphila]